MQSFLIGNYYDGSAIIWGMNSQTIIAVVVVIGVTLFSMILHELMHGLTAYWLGDDTAKVNGRLTLNPLKHIDPWLTIILPVILVLTNMPVFGGAKPVPYNPNKVRGGEWGAALVAIAGPLTNLVLAFICFLLLAVLLRGGVNAPGIVITILSYGVSVNLGFFAFNILPILPLDGSRVLYAVAPEGFQRVMDGIERMGLLLIFIIVLVASPLLSQLLTLIINGVMDAFTAVVCAIMPNSGLCNIYQVVGLLGM